MKFQRVIQFNMALVDTFRTLSKLDMKFITEYLDHETMKVFMDMNNINKHHCIRVAKAIIDNKHRFMIEDKLDQVVIAALLHDVGKAQCRQNIIFKVLFVLGKNPYRRGNIKWQEADRYYNHAKISRTMLENKNLDNMILDIIENHHSENNEEDNKYLKALKYCDENN